MTGLRQKMEQVESKFEECYTMMENTEGTVKELWGAAEETKALATSLIREAVEKMQAEFKERDEEMDHKFSLQVAENKRLQGHGGDPQGEQAPLRPGRRTPKAVQAARGRGLRRVRTWLVDVRLRLVTSQGSPYPSRSPRAHPSGWTRTFPSKSVASIT